MLEVGSLLLLLILLLLRCLLLLLVPLFIVVVDCLTKKGVGSPWGIGGLRSRRRLKEGSCGSADLGAEFDPVIRGAGFMRHFLRPASDILFLHLLFLFSQGRV